MADLEINCVTKSDRSNPYERILQVGGGSLLLGWRKSQEKVIEEIEGGVNAFHVGGGMLRVKVVVAVDRFGNKYIKTEPDGEEENNLLNLPDCD